MVVPLEDLETLAVSVVTGATVYRHEIDPGSVGVA